MDFFLRYNVFNALRNQRFSRR